MNFLTLKALQTRIVLLVFIIILLLGGVLRYHNLFAWPRTGATFDEYAWAWQGLSIIKTGVPTSWSPHPQYEDVEQIVYQDAHFRLVTPYLEHPPLFGLIAGSYAYLNGVEDLLDVNIERIRGLALALGVLSIFGLFLLVKEIYDQRIALVSALLYATIPTIVVGSRIVQNENFFIPVFLFSLYFLARFLKTKDRKFQYLSTFLVAILPLAKVPWLAAPFSFVLIYFFLRRYKEGLMIAVATLAFFAGYILYGMYFNADLFFNLWSLQLQRYDLTFTSFFALFTSPWLVDRLMLDGWIYFGWFSIFLLMSKELKKHFLVVIPFIVYLTVFIVGIPNEPGHGWYRYPFYPFLVISIALFLKEYFNKNYLLTFLFLLFTGLSLLTLSFERSFGFSFFVMRTFVFLSALSLLPLFFKGTKIKNLSGITSYSLLFFIFLLNIWSVLSYNEQ